MSERERERERERGRGRERERERETAWHDMQRLGNYHAVQPASGIPAASSREMLGGTLTTFFSATRAYSAVVPVTTTNDFLVRFHH